MKKKVEKKRDKNEKFGLQGKRSRTRSFLSLSGRTQIGAARGETAEKELLNGTLTTKNRKKAEQNKIKFKKVTTAPGKTKQQLWLGMRFVMQ